MTVLLLVVCGLCALAVVYPYVLYPLILARLPARPLRAGAAPAGRLSLAFCAYNEQAVRPAMLATLRALRAAYPTL